MDKVKQYFSHPGLNSSKLKLATNPKELFMLENNLLEDMESKALRIGSAVDCILTQPEKWDELFDILPDKRPSGQMDVFIRNLPYGLDRLSDVELYRSAYEKSGYALSIETVIDRFWSNPAHVKLYELQWSSSKTILTKDEYTAAMAAVDEIIKNPYALKYFSSNSIFQIPIYFTHCDLECKALVDGIYIDHERMELIPFDLKTSSRDITKFKEIFEGYGYDVQCGMYWIALNKWKNESGYADYKLSNFRFIVTPSVLNSVYTSLVYKVSDQTIQKCVEKVESLMELYKWYKKHMEKCYFLPKNFVDEKGELEI